MNNASQIELEKYKTIIFRRKYLFITASLLILSITVWGSFFLPEIYEAKSTVFIEQSVIKDLIDGISSGSSRNYDDMLRGLEHSMLSKKVLLNVMKEMDFDVSAKSDAELEGEIRNFIDNTYVNSHSRENFFTVSYRGQDPEMVQKYVNLLVKSYIENITSIKKEDAYGASKFLSEQIDYYKIKISEIEDKLANFRREEGVYLAIDERTLVNSIKKYREEIEDVSMEIKKLNAKKQKIEQQLSGEKPFTLAMVDSDGSNSLPIRLKALEQKLQIMLTKYTENYPEVIKIKIEIDETRKKLNSIVQAEEFSGKSENDISAGMSMMNPLYQQLKEERFKIESEIDSLKSKEDTLRSRIKRNEDELQNIPSNKKVLANLERDRDTYQTLYEQLLAKLGHAEVNEQVEAQNKGETFKVMERASLPRKPISPDRVFLIIFGMVAGLASGFGAVLLREKIDTSIRDVDALKNQFKMKVLAVVPEIVSEQEVQKRHQFDRNIYVCSIFYLLIIGGVFVKEFINKFFGA